MRKWIIRCNLYGYDILQEFLEKKTVSYRTYDDIKKGDEIFIYGEKPLDAIFLKCIAEEVLEDAIEGYMKIKSNSIKLRPIENYLSVIDKVRYDVLLNKGMENFGFSLEVNQVLGTYLDSLTDDYYIY